MMPKWRKKYSGRSFAICIGKDLMPEQLRWLSGMERLFLRAVDSGLISSRVKPMTLKLVFTASLLDAQH